MNRRACIAATLAVVRSAARAVAQDAPVDAAAKESGDDAGAPGEPPRLPVDEGARPLALKPAVLADGRLPMEQGRGMDVAVDGVVDA